MTEVVFERAGCFAKFVFLVSGATGWLRFVIVVFPDHARLLFFYILTYIY